MTDCHIRQYKDFKCSHCKTVIDLEHYIYYCPKTQKFRDFFYEKINNSTHTPCVLNINGTFWNNVFGKIYLNHRGFISDMNFENIRKQCPILLQNWSKIQTLLSLMVGKAHKKYYKDFCTYQKTIQAANRVRKSNKSSNSPNQ